MANLSDKINAARKEGYSDDEIITHLSSTDLRDKIEAARKEGYSSAEITEYLGGAAAPQQAPKESSGYLTQLHGGTDRMLESLGTTAEQSGWTGTGQFLKNLTEEPEGYVSASEQFINREGEGFNWQDLPGAAVENAPQIGGSIASRGTGAAIGAGIGSIVPGIGTAVGAGVGAFAGPFLFEFAQQIGPLALERAKNDGLTEPTWKHWVAAAGGSTFAGVLNAIGIGGVGKLNSLLGIGKNITKETATEAGQSVIEQGTATIGTEAGGKIDLKQALGEGIIGGTTAGGFDAARNAKPMVDRGMDELSIRRQINKDPYARDKAEITDYANQLSERAVQENRELQSREINNYVSDLKNQATELLLKQKMRPDDQKAVLQSLNTAVGLSDERLNQIAGRSESPGEVKALVHRIQLIRALTVQQQARRGLRGWAALGASTLGGAVGAAAGAAIGGLGGGAAGAYTGQQIGRDIARRLRNTQSQGQRIDALVGTKQARRARLLLDRYGPSEATKAMNTLTERAAIKEAEAQEQAMVIEENRRSAAELRAFQKQRAEHIKAVEQARTREEKDKAQAEKKRHDEANRELRMQNMALEKVHKELRNKALLEKLEAQKTLNALNIEMAQTKTALTTAMAEAKAQGADRRREADIANIKGQMQKLALEIERRQELLKKAQLYTKQANKVTDIATPKVSKAVKRAREVGAVAIPPASVDQYGNPIGNETAFAEKKAFIQNLEREGMEAAENFPDREVGNIFIEAINDFRVYTGRKNQSKRMAVYANVLDTIPNDVEARRFVNKYIRPLAFAFEAETGAPARAGREDYGTTEDPDTEIPF
jgi:hypothetical protein